MFKFTLTLLVVILYSSTAFSQIITSSVNQNLSTTGSPTFGGLVVMNGNVGIGTSFTSTSALTVMNGNVGIGTWVPQNYFSVGSTSNFQIGTLGQIKELQGTAVNIGNTQYNINDGLLYSINNSSISAASGFVFQVNNGASTPLTMIQTGNVGIGSLVPGTQLDINGTVRSIGIDLNLAPLANGNVLVSNSVGLGTWMPPSTLPTTINLTTTGSSGSSTWTPGTQTLNIPQYSGGAGSNYWTNSAGVGNVGISTTTNSVGIGTTSAIGAQLVVMNGNVGIGTFAPTALFQVSGAGNPFVGIGSSAPSNMLQINMRGLGAIIPFGLKIDNDSNNSGIGASIGLQSYNSAGGNEIDMTSDLMQDFEIGNESSAGTPRGNIAFLVTDAATPIEIQADYPNNNQFIPAFVDDINNNVGIGTFTPVSQFDVAQKFNVLSSGNVGIGSLFPGQKLDVQGTVRGISGGTCTTLYKCQGGVDAGVIQTVSCVLCPTSTCVPMNGCF